jgi:hypothetical protein
MIIYNVTTNIEGSIAERWLQWMQEEHIPEVMQTGCFSSYKVVRLLEVDESEGPTYAVQYNADSKADYNRYIQLYAATMREKTFQKWGDRFIAFRSVMQVVETKGADEQA